MPAEREQAGGDAGQLVGLLFEVVPLPGQVEGAAVGIQGGLGLAHLQMGLAELVERGLLGLVVRRRPCQLQGLPGRFEGLGQPAQVQQTAAQAGERDALAPPVAVAAEVGQGLVEEAEGALEVALLEQLDGLPVESDALRGIGQKIREWIAHEARVL